MATARHRSTALSHRGRSLRLLLIAGAPLLALITLTASASTLTVRYSHTWSPALNEPSNYRPCCPSKAVFRTLPFTMNVHGSQKAVLTVRMKTNWVDIYARTYTPNIIQQGRYVHPTEIKISIHSGPSPGDHRAQCRIAGTGAVVNAQGPHGLDIADGNWHTITCTKYADAAGGTDVQVIVDGVAGPMVHSSRPIGDVINNDAVDLGGQGPTANKDSINGQFSFVSYSVD
jgi:hypothetical protein